MSPTQVRVVDQLTATLAAIMRPAASFLASKPAFVTDGIAAVVARNAISEPLAATELRIRYMAQCQPVAQMTHGSISAVEPYAADGIDVLGM